jgi:hypothetical protein
MKCELCATDMRTERVAASDPCRLLCPFCQSGIVDEPQDQIQGICNSLVSREQQNNGDDGMQEQLPELFWG